MFYVKGKMKDIVNARKDLREICGHKELELLDKGTKKPGAYYCLEKHARKILCE